MQTNVSLEGILSIALVILYAVASATLDLKRYRLEVFELAIRTDNLVIGELHRVRTLRDGAEMGKYSFLHGPVNRTSSKD